MALQPERVEFFLQQMEASAPNTFRGNTAQLFEHLDGQIKDNPVFVQYEAAKQKWLSWLEEIESRSYSTDWEMPTSFEDAKHLAYAVYRKIAGEADNTEFLFSVTGMEKFREAVQEFNHLFLPHFREAITDISNANPEFESATIRKPRGATVFVIHGHDHGLKSEVELLLTNGGVTYVVLHEQPDKGRTIVDKLLEESEHSSFAIAILSPDDLLSTGAYRARQNVILEMGYFIGLLGKERVRLLVKGDVEIPSDLYGILYEKYDDGGGWKSKLAKELIAAGIFVDLQAVISRC
jgi:predicted nucleotide-binding protein